MVAAIKQTVTVQHEGRIEIHSPDLHAGAQAEVIVLVQPQSAPTVDSRLKVFEELQRSMKLDGAMAAKWSQQVRAERAASGPQG